MRASDHPSHRFLETARKHLNHARFAADADFHAYACFNAHQAAEKAVKAVHYANGALVVFGHGIRQLIEDLNTPSLAASLSAAHRLDPYYAATRYPNRPDDGTPEESFSSDRSARALGLAHDIVTAAAHIIHASART
ncbi:MAG: HEPN domain-containing protein [Bryobacterales bacterium]|nr:HEPN domain-containing protein [Bryobacterales bacterium]MDE0622958.1 HEPN domain-containing protein [Bryobacterales bacterium]